MTSVMATIAIVGAGMMGTAVAYPLTDNGHTVRLVGTHLDAEIIASCKERRFHPRLKRTLPDGVSVYAVEELEAALADVEIIVSGVSSHGVHWAGRTLARHLRPGQIIVAVTKGLEANERGEPVLLPDVLARDLPTAIRDRVSFAAIGGPCIAGELAGNRQSRVIFASRNSAALERLAATFRTDYYHVWTTTDLLGLELCAALKNAYTLGVGLAAGVLEASGGPDDSGAYMHNLAAAAFGQAVTEMDRLLEVLGGTRAFAYGIPGAGDLYVTAQGGRSVRLGRLLGLGHSYSEARELMAGETLESAAIVGEMAKVLPAMEATGSIGAAELPLLRGLIEIVVNDRPSHTLLDSLFPDALPGS